MGQNHMLLRNYSYLVFTMSHHLYVVPAKAECRRWWFTITFHWAITCSLFGICQDSSVMKMKIHIIKGHVYIYIYIYICSYIYLCLCVSACLGLWLCVAVSVCVKNAAIHDENEKGIVVAILFVLFISQTHIHTCCQQTSPAGSIALQVS